MFHLFLKLIGIDAAGADSVSLHWRHSSWLVAGLALLPFAAWFIVARHRAGLPHIAPSPRRALSACRVLLLLLLVIVLGGPYVRMEEPARHKPVLIMLMDESDSMSLNAGPFEESAAPKLAAAAGIEADNGAGPQEARIAAKLNGLSRTELMRRVIETQRDSLFAPLKNDFELRAYRFAGAPRPAGMEQINTPTPPPGDDETALGAALERAMDDARGRRIAGIVLFTDGRWTTAPDPLEVMRPRAGSHGATPVFTVPIGSSAAVPDIALLDVLAPRTVAKGDVASIHTTIGSNGFDGQTVVARLLEGDRELDRATLVLRDNEPRSARLTLRDTAEAGPRLLRIAVDEQAGEQVKRNNAQTFQVRIEGGKRRVLYLESAPRWDYRFLDHAMRRDKGIDVTALMESQLLAAGVAPADLPAAAKLPDDAAGFAAYALVILGDISPDLLPPAQQSALAAAVRERGVGLIVQAGTQSMPQRFAGGPLENLLPVKVAVALARPFEARGNEPINDGIEAQPFAPFQMRLTAAGSIHPAFQLYDSATRGREAWSAMPDFYWAAQTIDAAPAATVLAEIVARGATMPLIAEHFAGRGRVLFIGTDSTYLWRRNIGDDLFYRFWGQAVRHVAMPNDRPADAGWIETQPQRAEPGETVMIEMFALDPAGAPRHEAELGITIASNHAAASSLALVRIGPPGHYRGTFVPSLPGPYRLSFNGGKTPLSTDVLVASSGRELLRPGVDRNFMINLADLTGGAMLEIDQLPKLASLLPRPNAEKIQAREAQVWDHWLTLLLIVGCYGIDLSVRKGAGVA